MRGFRNLESTVFEPGEHFNVIHGDNGAGKSNLLETIYYMSALGSFRGAKADDMIGMNAEEARIEAKLADEPLPHVLSVLIPRHGARKLQLDGKRPANAAKWFGTMPLVLFHPGHLELSAGPADGRRAFLDRALEQTDPAYARALANYQRALRSRNRLLKMKGVDTRAVTAYDEVLAENGSVVGQTRARFVSDIAPLCERAFEEVSQAQLPLKVTYAPRVAPSVETIRAALAVSLQKDLARGFTAEGPHGDDLALTVRDATRARHHASQGQHRAIVLALKVAELELLSRYTGRVPVLLLDDVSSELDRTRNKRFFSFLSHLGGQVFLTTTHPEFILLEGNRRDFHVEKGTVRRGA